MTGNAGRTWKRTGWYREPENLTELMSVLGAVGVYSSGQRFAWRGHSSSDFQVESSLFRSMKATNHGHLRGLSEPKLRRREEEILNQARDWGLGTSGNDHVDDLQLLADLQHYGIPTRLIDFTSNPMTALWFAAQRAPQGFAQSGVLLALNVTKHRRYASIGDAYAPMIEELENPRGWTLAHALKSAEPFMVEASLPNDRLRAQEGFFVAGSQPEVGLARLLTPFLSIDVPFDPIEDAYMLELLNGNRPVGRPRHIPFVAIIIKSRLKARLLQVLDGTYNRNAQTLFPDYEGLRSYLK